MKLKEYDDQFTLNGRLKVQPGVTPAKVQEAQRLLDAAKRSRRAQGEVEELFTTTDLAFSVAHLQNINTIPQIDEEEPDPIEVIAGKRTAKDFNPIVLREELAGSDLEGAGIDQHGAAAAVPEGTPYPIVTFQGGEAAYYQKFGKYGFQFDFTFEAIINDLLGEIEALPGKTAKVARQTRRKHILDALFSAKKYLEAVTLPNETTSTPNAALSPEAVIGAIVALENRKINKRKIGKIQSVNIVAAPGTERFFEYKMAQIGRILTIQDGAGDGQKILSPDTPFYEMMPKYNFIEDDRLTGKEWFMLPTVGSTKGRPVLERLTLRGYEEPEIRVKSDQGFYVGGAKVGIWEGGFERDTESFRFRQIGGGALWDDTWIVRSKGTGQP